MTTHEGGNIELTFPVVRDGDVIDGRDLAQTLMQAAFQLLVPYAGSCPACTDALFASLANDAVNAELQETEGRAPQACIYVLGDDDAVRQSAFAAHVRNTRRRTLDLVERGEGDRDAVIPHVLH